MADKRKPATGAGKRKTARGGRPRPAAKPGAAATARTAFGAGASLSDGDWDGFFSIVRALVRDADAVGQLQAWHAMRAQANAMGETNNLMRFFNIYRL